MSPDLVEAWAETYGREIHAYLWRMLGDRQDAEDGLQETFLRALRHRNPAPIAAPRAWLYAIATNVARTHLRRRRPEDPLDDFEHLASEAPSRETSERVAALRRVVEGLPLKQRAALILRRYQELTYDEVARAIGSSPEAARANVYQALKRLKALVPEEAR